VPPGPFERFSPRPEEVPLLRNPVLWVAVVIVLSLGAGLYYWRQRVEQEQRLEEAAQRQQQEEQRLEQPPQAQEEQPAAAEPEVSQSPAEAGAESQVRYALPKVEPPPGAEGQALPKLAESDEAVRRLLAGAAEKRAFDQLPLTADVVRRIVATIDNLPRKHVSPRLLPLRPPPGDTVTNGRGEAVRLSPRNYARYARHVALAKAVDAKKVVAIYVYYYPLFQQSYEELGYPNRYFNDRVVDVIDHLLATPDVQGPVELVRPKVFYEFADPELEELSAGQKVLVRIGPENAAVIKAKLREIRRELVAEAPAPGN
jgi:hypothetical protein